MPRVTQGKKLVSVWATFASVTCVGKEAQVTQVTQETPEVILDRVPCIYYPVQFRKNKSATIQALIDSGSEVNAMAPAYAAKLGLKVCPINARAQKIDGSSFITFGMVIAGFQVEDKLDRQGSSKSHFHWPIPV